MIDKICLERYEQTACRPCVNYRENIDNPMCFKGILSFPLLRCGDYEAESQDELDHTGEVN